MATTQCGLMPRPYCRARCQLYEFSTKPHIDAIQQQKLGNPDHAACIQIWKFRFEPLRPGARGARAAEAECESVPTRALQACQCVAPGLLAILLVAANAVPAAHPSLIREPPEQARTASGRGQRGAAEQ